MFELFGCELDSRYELEDYALMKWVCGAVGCYVQPGLRLGGCCSNTWLSVNTGILVSSRKGGAEKK